MSPVNKAAPKKFKITSKGMRTVSEVPGVGYENSVANITQRPAISNKRGPEPTLESQKGKLRKLDNSVKQQCASLLRELMSSPGGSIFNEPVDPERWQIPDYFSIIDEPMDLGTIKKKLEGNSYCSTEDFAADVRLTFSNAMRYNPPGNTVHKLAMKLNGHFSRKWNSLDAKWNNEKNEKKAHVAFDIKKDDKGFKKAVEMESQHTKQIGINGSALRFSLSIPMTLEEKQKLRSKLVELSTGKMVESSRTMFDEFGLTDLREEMLQSYIDTTDDRTLKKLRREIKDLFDRGTCQVVEPVNMVENGSSIAGNYVQKGPKIGGRAASVSTGLSQSIDPTEAKCSSCGNWSCHCHAKSASAHASSSDISSERSLELGHSGDSKFDFEVKCLVSAHSSRLGPDSDGPGIVVNEESSPRISTPAAIVASNEGWTSFNIQMSPKKALRAAMLKSRFADTIFRATHGGKSDPAWMQQEREKLEREQLKEKARIEKEIKAAEAAMRMKVQAELKMRREREREAARIALQKVEKTVEIDENRQILKDLEMVCSWGSLPDGHALDEVVAGPSGKILERLGLYMKKDYLEEDEDAILSIEDGEILL